MWLSRTALLTITVVMVTRFVNTLDVNTSDDPDAVVRKRYTLDPNCRHCNHFPEDRSACYACYRRWKYVPYFSLKKRRSDRASFRMASYSCRCCLANGDPVCCETCSSNDVSKRSEGVGDYYEKRGFQTSFYDPQFYSSDNRCYCCRNEAFNYACCLSCLKRRRR